MLINDLKTQLISKDDEYFKLLGFFSDDIDKFLQVMETRRAELKHTYASQLEAVEHAFLLDRSEVRREQGSQGEKGSRWYLAIYVKKRKKRSFKLSVKGT